MRKNLMFLALVIVFAAAAFADVQFTSTTVSPSTPRPGNTGSISFTVTNTGTSAISGLTLAPSGNGFESFSDSVSVGTLGASGSTQTSIQFKVSPNTESGVYNIMINVYWNENTASGGTGYKLVQIPVTVSKQTIFQISSSPVTVGIGDDFELKATIKNTGGRASNVVMAINSPYFIVKDSSKLIIDDLGRGAEASINVPILTNFSMPAGLYAVPVSISYQDDLGGIQQTTAILGTVQAVRGSSDFSVTSSTDSAASPGKRVKMTITVRNDGTLATKSVKTTLSSASSNFVPLGSSQRLIGDMKPGETASTSYDVGISASATPGYYPIVLSVDYLNRQGDAQATVTKDIGIEVIGEPKLSIITSTNPSPVAQGGKYSLGVQISNTGTTGVNSLRVTVESDSFIVLDNSQTAFIGNLKTDDYSQVSYNVLVKAGTLPGKYPITVKMNFADAYNAEKEIVETSYLQVIEPDVAASLGMNGNGGSGNTILLAIGLVVVLIIAYLIYRRTRKQNGKKAQVRV
ncbi:MAG: CARDB domain-containing protein [Candidatus Micrarchaeota archaeon]